MNRIVMPSLLALALTLGAAFAPAPADDEAAVRAVLARYVDATNRHDAEAHTALYADGAVIVWPGSEPVVVSDRAAFLEGGRRWHAANTALQLEAGPSQVHFLSDDTAIAVVQITGRAGSETMAMNVMLVLTQTADGWRIAAEHDAAAWS